MDVSLLLAFWELFLVEDNLSLPFFFGLVLIERNRNKILQRQDGKPVLLQDLRDTVFDCYIADLEDLESMCAEAKTLQSNTPRTVIKNIRSVLGGHAKGAEIFALQNSFVVEMDVGELKNSKRRHFVVDLREPGDFQRVHLPHSYSLPRSLRFSTEEYWLILAAFSYYFAEKTGTLCNLSILAGELQDDQCFASTLALDLSRRGLERLSLLKPTAEALTMASGQGTRPHETELCHRCEVNRNVRLSAEGHVQRAGRVLSAMIYHWLQDEATSSHLPTPLHSEYNTPRTEIGHCVPSSQTYGIHGTAQPAILAGAKGGSIASTKMGSIGEMPLGLKRSMAAGTEERREGISTEDISKGARMIWGNQLYEGEVLFEQFARESPACALHFAEAAFLRVFFVPKLVA